MGLTFGVGLKLFIMITLAWYLLKVIICSGILCGYYFLALRNKAFHRWNRFYLLAAVVISLAAPIIKIDVFQNNDDKGTVVQMLQTISYGDEAVIEYSKNSGFQLNTENLAESAYLLISLIFFAIFFVSLFKIKRLRKKYPETKIEDISFINTKAKGTPFSFFKSIFWNDAIDLQTKTGQQIFNHEIAHVKEKHSYDKIFLNLVLIFFWINPFFWLMRKELYMIHEFIADKEALEDSDINTFAEMILQSVYPGQNFSSTNNFFYSPIKRRILMLAKNKNPKVNYISRLLVLPLAAIVFFAFTLKVKNEKSLNLYDGKTITVVIDAGHGGQDNGAVSADGVKEKNITLALAKEVAELNTNPHINILLSRNNDQTIPVKERVLFAQKNHADLFISLHVNSAVNKQLDGFSVLIDKENSEKNLLLGSSLIKELKNAYKIQEQIGVRKNGIWILDENVCPAALIECGYLSNSGDEAFISEKNNQQMIARNILKGIESYSSSLKTLKEDPTILNDTISSNQIDSIPYAIYLKSKALFVVDGKTSTNKEAEKINPNNIKSINVLKGEDAIKKYGEKGKEGVIEITTKKNGQDRKIKQTYFKFAQNDTVPDKVFTKVEHDAQFPGGLQAWIKYISRAITDSISKFTEEDYGTCVIRFIVDVDGKVSDVVATTMKGTKLAKVSVNAIKKGPKWIPASQNGHKVAAYRLQPVTLAKPDKNKELTKRNIADDDQKVFTKLEQNASFPGGQAAWLRYITRIIDKHANELAANKNNFGTCKVRFIVDKSGTISDVKATTMQGTKLAEVAVNAIKHSPEWIPGKQNGHDVNSFVMQSVSFKLNDNIGLKNEPE